MASRELKLPAHVSAVHFHSNSQHVPGHSSIVQTDVGCLCHQGFTLLRKARGLMLRPECSPAAAKGRSEGHVEGALGENHVDLAIYPVRRGMSLLEVFTASSSP